jgi:formylglycine-generating enzyme required for sulfatase activity
MAGKIFINYRRDDSIGTAGRLHDRLAQTFGRDKLFMDVDHIPAGVDFVAHLNRQVASCNAILVIIGPNWLDAKDESGGRRLDNPDDFVTLEIAAALARDIRVIPVLVDGARMPKADKLPDSIKPLVRRNAVEVRNAHFGQDAEALVARMREALGDESTGSSRWRFEPRSRRRAVMAAAAVAVLLMVGWGGYALVRHTVEQRPQQAEPKREEEQDARRDPAFTVAPGSGQSFRDQLASGQPCPICPEMVVAPSGGFTMGSPISEPDRESDEAQVWVSIARPFAVGKFAVAFDEWDACVTDGGCNGHRPDDQGWGRGKRPVITVNWDDANAYAAWLSRKSGKTYRLLSEAEREYVARAGTTTPFWWGSSITPNQANYDSSAGAYGGRDPKGEYRKKSMPVDSFEPNPWGLYNVHGNVWEWTADCWNSNNAGNPGDGSARTTGICGRRVVRGGSWNSGPRFLRAADRDAHTAYVRNISLGFRLARTLNP